MVLVPRWFRKVLATKILVLSTKSVQQQALKQGRPLSMVIRSCSCHTATLTATFGGQVILVISDTPCG
jgi:hypothetical protein